MGPTPKGRYTSENKKGLRRISKSSGHKGKVDLDETQLSEANRVNKIFIQDHLLKMLTNVKHRLKF